MRIKDNLVAGGALLFLLFVFIIFIPTIAGILLLLTPVIAGIGYLSEKGKG